MAMFILLSVLNAITSFGACAADRSALRYAVEATYIYKFASFVTWPPVADDRHAPLRLCIIGRDPVADLLQDAVRGHSVDGKPIALRLVAPDGTLDGCAVLYMARQPSPALITRLHGTPILTVAEADAARPIPAIISFVVVGGRVRFDIDENLAAQADLTISSKLLSLARRLTLPPKEVR